MTHTLFSSPHLRFLRAQQTAVLDWVKALGAPEVPSMYAVKKTREHIMNLLRSPMEKITTASGNVFYLNAISKAIAMVNTDSLSSFSNPFANNSTNIGFFQSAHTICNAGVSRGWTRPYVASSSWKQDAQRSSGRSCTSMCPC